MRSRAATSSARSAITNSTKASAKRCGSSTAATTPRARSSSRNWRGARFPYVSSNVVECAMARAHAPAVLDQHRERRAHRLHRRGAQGDADDRHADRRCGRRVPRRGAAINAYACAPRRARRPERGRDHSPGNPPDHVQRPDRSDDTGPDRRHRRYRQAARRRRRRRDLGALARLHQCADPECERQADPA